MRGRDEQQSDSRGMPDDKRHVYYERYSSPTEMQHVLHTTCGQHAPLMHILCKGIAMKMTKACTSGSN